MQTGLTILGNWDKQIGAPLNDALGVSTSLMGKSGERACRDALIFMAQSARKLTKKAKKNRKVKYDPRAKRSKYVDNYKKGRSGPQRLYEFQFSEAAVNPIDGTWAQAKKIGNQGLAQRSWLWGLAKLKPMKTGKSIPGTSKVFTIRRGKAAGYIKEDNLSYIQKAMPNGWEEMVQRSAGNRIMEIARKKLEGKWRREMGLAKWKKGMPKQEAAALSKYFLKG